MENQEEDVADRSNPAKERNALSLENANSLVHQLRSPSSPNVSTRNTIKLVREEDVATTKRDASVASAQFVD